MKKLLAILFAVAVFVPAAQAYDYTLGGQLGYGYNKEKKAGVSENYHGLTVAPEFAVLLKDDVNAGLGLKYNYRRADNVAGADHLHTFGTYLFGEKAVLSVGALKVFLRADVGYETSKWKSNSDPRAHAYYAQVSPNVQYPLTERLTLTLSSDVLTLGVNHVKAGSAKSTKLGFNAGRNNILQGGYNSYGGSGWDAIRVGLKYAF